jgi:hypothetical protein
MRIDAGGQLLARVAVDGAQALADDDRLAPADAAEHGGERSGGQHAIGVHEHDEGAEPRLAQIGDGLGVGERQGHAIRGVADAREELVHEDEAHAHAGGQALETGLVAQMRSVGRLGDDRQLEVAILDEMGEVAVGAQRGEAQAQPPLDVGRAPDRGDHADAGLGGGVQRWDSAGARGGSFLAVKPRLSGEDIAS